MSNAVIMTSSLRKWSKSLSNRLFEEDGAITKPTLKAEAREISRDHWKKGHVLQKCHGCHCQLIILFYRHHCRMCGNIFCHDCSKYKRRLSEDTEPNPDGDIHRVCLYCAIDGEDASLGHTRSWTRDFRDMKHETRKEKKKVCDQQPEIKLVCEVPSVFLPITEQFRSDVIKQKPRAVHERLNATLKALKREKDCTACDRQINIPTDRKECTVCGDIFCKKCSSEDLVVFYPHGTNFRPGDTDVNVQPRIAILEGEDISRKAEIWRNYRVCRPCLGHLGTTLKEFDFNLKFRDVHIQLMDLRSQLLSSLDKVASKAGCTKMIPLQEDGFEVVMAASNTDCLEMLPSQEDGFEMVIESPDESCTLMLPVQKDEFDVLMKSPERNRKKLYRACSNDPLRDIRSDLVEKLTSIRLTSDLLHRYFSVHDQLSEKVLQPQTPAQVRMLKNMTTASNSFYIEKRQEYTILIDQSVSLKLD